MRASRPPPPARAALWLCLLLPLVQACAEPDGDPAEAGFSAVLLLPGPENDEGWNQAAYEGLARIREELGARTRKLQASTHTEIQKRLERAVVEGFDVVFGHGVEFNGPAARVAQQHPEVAFVTSGGAATADNLATLVLRLEEAAYQLGILAGHLTRTGTVSALSGMAFEPVERVVRGFQAGFRSVRPDGRVLEEYLGSWEDSTLAKEKAIAHAQAGADVFFQNADAAGVGVFEACEELGLVAFGCNRDQTAKNPRVILASAVADIPATLLDLAREVQEGRFHGGVRTFGMGEGRVRVAFNPALEARVPAAARAAMAAAREAILAGTLTPGDP